MDAWTFVLDTLRGFAEWLSPWDALRFLLRVAYHAEGEVMARVHDHLRSWPRNAMLYAIRLGPEAREDSITWLDRQGEEFPETLRRQLRGWIDDSIPNG